MDIRTHLRIDPRLCGTPMETAAGDSRVTLTTTAEMAADDRGLVHGGFVFGLADYAAMIAVNDPNVVLGSADVRFLKPVVVGDTLVAEASTEAISGKKHRVSVAVKKEQDTVFTGIFTCFVLDQHVLGN